jgi:hypothetical protein
VSQGWFPDLVEEFSWKCMAGRPPQGQLAMNFGQTDLVKLVHFLLLSWNYSHQALVDLVPKWGQSAKVGPTGHFLGPLGRGFILCGLPGQWTPVVIGILIIFTFRSLEKFKIAFHVRKIK